MGSWGVSFWELVVNFRKPAIQTECEQDQMYCRAMPSMFIHDHLDVFQAHQMRNKQRQSQVPMMIW